jgi:hypothetical protein
LGDEVTVKTYLQRVFLHVYLLVDSICTVFVAPDVPNTVSRFQLAVMEESQYAKVRTPSKMTTTTRTAMMIIFTVKTPVN